MAGKSEAAAIRRQVEFYFSDANLRRDEFLRKQLDDNEGSVALETLLTFNRLKALTTDAGELAAALRESAELVVNEEGTTVKRARKLALLGDEEALQRTVYVKGFGAKNAELTIEFVEKMFEEYGEIAYVELRRNERRALKGSVLLEFKTKDGADALLKAKAKVQYKARTLIVQEAAVWKQEKEEHEKATAKRKREAEETEAKEKEDAEKACEPGSFIRVSGIPATMSWRTVRIAINAIGIVRHVEFEDKEADADAVDGADGADAEDKSADADGAGPATRSAIVRAGSAEEADKIVAQAASEAGLVIEEAKVSAEKITGDEEQGFLEKARASILQAARSGGGDHKRRRFGGRGRGRGGRGGRGGRRR